MDPSGHLRTILAIKLKRLRKQRGLTLGEVSQATGLSVSYLAEIEGGKKYPKPDRILQLAAALQTPYDELTSSRLEHDFEELHSFINAPALRNFPFDFFGVPASDLVKLLARSPAEVTALIRTVHEVAHQYDFGVEHFLHAALRSYVELTDNEYPQIEQEAERFAQTLARSGKGARSEDDALRRWVLSNGIEEIDEATLASRPGLRQFRSILLERPPVRLLLNPMLSASQKKFVLAREAGYRVLGLKARSFTAPPDREDSFEQVRNDSQASYFAGALLLPRKALAADLRAFFRLPTWQPAVLVGLLHKYRVTPETLMYRISQLAPAEFHLRAHFLKFAEVEGQIRVVKLVNLSGLPMLSGMYAKEQYCRRWLATRLLGEFRRRERRQDAIAPHVGVQYSRFAETADTYFNFGMALAQPLDPAVAISLTVGCKADDQLHKAIRFAKDPTIPQIVVGGTCERCGLDTASCADRAAAPVIYLRERARDEAREELQQLALLHRRSPAAS